MTFWHSLSEEAKDAVIIAIIMVPAMIFAGAIGVYTDWNVYDLLMQLVRP